MSGEEDDAGEDSGCSATAVEVAWISHLPRSINIDFVEEGELACVREGDAVAAVR